MKIKFFKIAKTISLKSDHHSHKIGCVIVKKNRIVSLGFNQLKTHTKSQFPFKTVHAEFHALLNTPLNELQGATAYVYRAHKDNSPQLARPCPSCFKMLVLAGIKKVCYSNNGSFTEEIL